MKILVASSVDFDDSCGVMWRYVIPSRLACSFASAGCIYAFHAPGLPFYIFFFSFLVSSIFFSLSVLKQISSHLLSRLPAEANA